MPQRHFAAAGHSESEPRPGPFDSSLHSIGAELARLRPDRPGETSRREARSVLYRFGEFELDAAAYTLTRCGQELSLQPKVFDLMRCLLDRRGQVVTKAELLDAVWPGEHVN